MDVTLMSGKKVSLLNKMAQPPWWCHVDAIRQELVVRVFNCFLQGDGVPLLRN